MKLILILLLTSTALRAQVPHIDYMIADEAKSQLQIHGTFGPDTTGFVTIENTKQTVRSWSDTMLICDLPDSGAGSGGHVTVKQMSGTSNARMLSIFSVNMDHGLFQTIYNSNGDVFFGEDMNLDWIVSWRTDLGFRNQGIDTMLNFEISKMSYCITSAPGPLPRENWTDSTNHKDSGISLSGSIDLKNFTIHFNQAYLIFDTAWPQSQKIYTYQAKVFQYDTLGSKFGYRDSGTNWKFFAYHWDDKVSGKMLFPPGIKNAVSKSPKPTSDLIKIFSHIASGDHQISFVAEEPLGEVAASLYSIDGRLLKQERISILSAGIYSFDAGGVNARFGILVFKTDKGLFARKVLF